MGFGDKVISQDGEIGFFGQVRGADETGHDMFQVGLPGRPRLYGEYKREFSDNGNDFDIAIVSFGLRDEGNVGAPGAPRLALSAIEKAAVQELIRLLFCAAEGAQARRGIGMFSKPKSTYLGGLEFLPGWVIQEPASGREASL